MRHQKPVLFFLRCPLPRQGPECSSAAFSCLPRKIGKTKISGFAFYAVKDICRQKREEEPDQVKLSVLKNVKNDLLLASLSLLQALCLSRVCRAGMRFLARHCINAASRRSITPEIAKTSFLYSEMAVIHGTVDIKPANAAPITKRHQ